MQNSSQSQTPSYRVSLTKSDLEIIISHLPESRLKSKLALKLHSIGAGLAYANNIGRPVKPYDLESEEEKAARIERELAEAERDLKAVIGNK